MQSKKRKYRPFIAQRRRNRNRVLQTIAFWVALSACLLTAVVHTHAHARTPAERERDNYLDSQLLAYHVKDIVPVEWVKAADITPDTYGPGWTVWGDTRCDSYLDKTGNYVVCKIRLAWPGKPHRGGYKDTIRHELCHVVAESVAVGHSIPGDVHSLTIALAAGGQHDDPEFLRCAAYHKINLDPTG